MFYRLDASRVQVREFWWETKLLFWVGIIIKLLRIRLRGSTDDLAVDSLRPFLVDETAVAADVRGRFTSTLDTLRGLGFEPPHWYVEEDVYQATRNTLALLRHGSGRAWARVQCRINFGHVPAKVKFFSTFVSSRPGGFVVTGNGKYDMAWPASHDTVRFRTMPVEQVWERHQRRLTANVQPIAPEKLLDAHEDFHASLRDFHLARGVFQPLNDEELASYPPAPPPVLTPTVPWTPPPLPTKGLTTPPEGAAYGLPAAAPTPVPFPAPAPAAPPDLLELATLDELRRLQTKQANWRFSIALLLVSAALFILNSRRNGAEQSWEFVGILLGVLLFHELGHFLAMKAFGYRNLRMFFIPGFGAAVSGRHYNAPAWKKIVVSLMGPLPGIFVGLLLLVLALPLRNELLFQIGFVAVILNLFNLIPVLPLDGGWVAHAALFARHPTLDVGFRLATALLVILLGVLIPGGRFLSYVGIAGLVTLPMAYGLARVVNELRSVPGLGVSPDSQTIPEGTARVILAKVRQRFTRQLNARLAARHVASVFESLNARPPSAGATVGLLALHAGTVVVALVVGVAAIAIHNPGLTTLARQRAREAHAVTPEQIETVNHPPPSPRNVLVIRFKDEAASRAAMAELPPAQPASRLAQALFVAFTPAQVADQRALFDRYEKRAQRVFVESAKMRCNVGLTFKLADTPEARSAFEELDVYVGSPARGLIPPWASQSQWPAEQRVAQTELRRLVAQLARGPSSTERVPRDLLKKISEAQRRDDTAEVERLRAEVAAKTAAAEKAFREQLAAEFGHAEVIAAWADIYGSKDWRSVRKRLDAEIAPRLGRWPPDQPDDELVVSGYASNHPGTATSVDCEFAHVDTGLVALARWLFAHGASDMHYTIHDYATHELDDETEE